MNNSEDRKTKILEYVTLVGEQALKEKEMERLQNEIGLTRTEILEEGKKLALSSLEKQGH